MNWTWTSVGRTLERSNRARITSTDIGGPEALDEAVQLIGANAIQADASKLEDLDPRRWRRPEAKGKIDVVVSSLGHALHGPGNHSTYAATKAALRSYPRTWAAEFKDSGLRANTLSPGVVDTPMSTLTLSLSMASSFAARGTRGSTLIGTFDVFVQLPLFNDQYGLTILACLRLCR